ncbi:uncharacterized protein LOC108099080 [Drosophila ficusphila]|uniref:uncharacterized protein LOC108099080 n=1 Tax=Drosophila ficusphila TaxID=30025 RepID=UPI0007E7BE3C|nr:uncharacterized protein LOC108099080 [Drosophila ficusphila]
MLVAALQHSYSIECVSPISDWAKQITKRGGEGSLLYVLALSMFTQLLLALYVGLAVFQPCSLRRKQLNEWQRRIYASFIFRRLLLQLDETFRPHGSPGKDQLGYCRSCSEKVILAIQHFRRDAFRVLQPGQDLSSALSSELYYVLDEEEYELAVNGYGCSCIKIEVIEDLLMCLMYPERIVQES